MGASPQSPTQWLDFHEISILLAIESSQPDPSSAKSASDIIAMRRAGREWEEIARALGCTDVDAVARESHNGRVELRPAARAKRGGKTARRHVA
jgi:hypothetical protein